MHVELGHRLFIDIDDQTSEIDRMSGFGQVIKCTEISKNTNFFVIPL